MIICALHAYPSHPSNDDDQNDGCLVLSVLYYPVIWWIEKTFNGTRAKNLFNGMLRGFVCTYWGLAFFPWLTSWGDVSSRTVLAPLRTGPNKGTKVRWLGPVKLCKTPIQATPWYWFPVDKPRSPNHSMPGAQEGQENMFATAAAQLCLELPKSPTFYWPKREDSNQTPPGHV